MCKRIAPHLSEYTGSCFAKALLLTCQKTREAVFKRTAPHLSEYTGSWFHKDYSSLMLGSKGSSHNRSVAWTGLESDWHHMFLTSWCFQSPQISYSSNCGLIFLTFQQNASFSYNTSSAPDSTRTNTQMLFTRKYMYKHHTVLLTVAIHICIVCYLSSWCFQGTQISYSSKCGLIFFNVSTKCQF